MQEGGDFAHGAGALVVWAYQLGHLSVGWLLVGSQVPSFQLQAFEHLLSSLLLKRITHRLDLQETNCWSLSSNQLSELTFKSDQSCQTF